ncbi:MAG: hypothetical protein M3143_07185, partial [Actinomycetota bacterium]|nr:hypothetical protein [Actinomycetota bacterium]
MTFPDPEEQDREGPARHYSSEDTGAAFAGIVAGLHTGPDSPRWPAEEDHFEPPEPPPLPVPRPRTVGGVALLAAGVLLLVAPNLLDQGQAVATSLGLLALTAGIGVLVLG